jgi:hypothetical protein
MKWWQYEYCDVTERPQAVYWNWMLLASSEIPYWLSRVKSLRLEYLSSSGANKHFMSLPYSERNFKILCAFLLFRVFSLWGVIVHPLTILVVVLILGYVVARVIISGRPFMDFKQKQFVMVVRQGRRDFVEFAIARRKQDAERELQQRISQKMLEAGLNPFDGTTEYRLFGRTTSEVRPSKIMVFHPERTR